MTETQLLNLIREYFDEMIEENDNSGFPENYEDCCKELLQRFKGSNYILNLDFLEQV